MGGLGLLSSRPPVVSTPQLQIQADLKGKRKAEGGDDSVGRKRTDIGEGDVDSRLDKKKLDEVLSGKAATYGGKPVTEEEMGKLHSSDTHHHCTDTSDRQQRRTGCRRVKGSRIRWRSLAARSCSQCNTPTYTIHP